MKNCELRIPNSEFRNSRLCQGFGGQADGVALIMVLWVIAILSVVVLEFSLAMRTEVHITKNYKEELQLYGMVEGGAQRAIVELIYKHDPRVRQIRKTLISQETSPDHKQWVMDGRSYLIPFDQGTCEIRIMSEAGKVNINVVSETMLRKIMGQLGLEGEKRDIVVDSILDWRDPDDFYRVNGAENDYYQSLKEPYNCKNGNLDSVEELLLVRGVTTDLFYGKKGIKRGEEESEESEGSKVDRIGLKEIFSIYSFGEQIDINSATPLVLNVVLGLPKEVSQQIAKAREEKGFDNLRDLLHRVPELSPFIGEIGRLILFQSAIPFYTIEARARFKEGESIRGLKMIVKIDPREKGGHKIIQWVDALI
jgi:general secretion pathway protein K